MLFQSYVTVSDELVANFVFIYLLLSRVEIAVPCNCCCFHVNRAFLVVIVKLFVVLRLPWYTAPQ